MLIPTGDKVLVRIPVDGNHTTKSGIIVLAEKDKHVSFIKAIVLATGPGELRKKTGVRVPLQVKPGDTVYLMRYAGTRVEPSSAGVDDLEPGEDLRLCLEDDIYMVLANG